MEETKTSYTYDSMYRIASTAATTNTGTALNVSYSYADDMLTSIETDSTTYSFNYGDFSLRSNIAIGSQTLASYSYSTDGNHFLTSLDYGNRDSVDYTYDEIGNLLVDEKYDYTWRHGRELQYISEMFEYWRMTYDINGLRTKRESNVWTYGYVYSAGQLSSMKIWNSSKGKRWNLYFTYDANGAPMTVKYNGTLYYYVTNLQGDVIAILDSSGNSVVEYSYDAWGNVLSVSGSQASTIGEDNPLRYRGYVYDKETKLYYLESRYYNPTLGRFINADAYAATGQGFIGNNMFVYCLNNPVNLMDESGNSARPARHAENVTIALPYSSVREAALAFANEYYSITTYTRHELGTYIYSKTINGVSSYDYGNVVVGKPHSVKYEGVIIPKGTHDTATIHTHPNSLMFSGTNGDIANAESRGIDSYIVVSNLTVKNMMLKRTRCHMWEDFRQDN